MCGCIDSGNDKKESKKRNYKGNLELLVSKKMKKML